MDTHFVISYFPSGMILPASSHQPVLSLQSLWKLSRGRESRLQSAKAPIDKGDQGSSFSPDPIHASTDPLSPPLAGCPTSLGLSSRA